MIRQWQAYRFGRDADSDRLGKNQYGPAGAEVTAMRFRIKTPAEGEGIELLPIGGPRFEQ